MRGATGAFKQISAGASTDFKTTAQLSLAFPKRPLGKRELRKEFQSIPVSQRATSEEKLLIQFIDKRYPDLKKKFSDAYLIRNERHFKKIYNFGDGRPLEPDFLLYLIGKEIQDTMHYQVFIEPKGGHLLLEDAWKEQMLASLKDKAVIEQLWRDRKYAVWGMPFFNNSQRMLEFESAFKSLME